MQKQLFIWCLFLILHGGVSHAEQLRIVSYNVENLFDCEDDSLKNDNDFLPEGLYHWNSRRYREKLHQIAQVIAVLGDRDGEEWQAPAVVTLLEVENRRCLEDLCRYHLPRGRFPYAIVHFESPDQRGVDAAMLIDTTRLRILHAEAIPVPLPTSDRPTRDILYAEVASEAGILHLYACHWPSQLGGAKNTQYKRDIAYQALYAHADSILATDSMACLIAMGDFNSQPLPAPAAYCNLMAGDVRMPRLVAGTHQYQGRWMMLDQFIVAKKLSGLRPSVFAPDWLLEKDYKYLGYKPKRTYIGPAYHGGYSDHLPIFLDLPIQHLHP